MTQYGFGEHRGAGSRTLSNVGLEVLSRGQRWTLGRDNEFVGTLESWTDML